MSEIACFTVARGRRKASRSSAESGSPQSLWTPITNRRDRLVAAPYSAAFRVVGPQTEYLSSTKPRASSKTPRASEYPSPLTFSITKNAGRTSRTILKKSRNRSRRGSETILFPIALKPWQGGPPTIPSGCPPAAARTASAHTADKSRPIRRVSAKFTLNEDVKTGSLSNAAATRNPACLAPSESPPAPANRSTIRRWRDSATLCGHEGKSADQSRLRHYVTTSANDGYSR